MKSQSDPKLIPLVGEAAESDVLIGDKPCKALLDTGSMVTLLSETFYENLDPKPELLSLTDFQLDIRGASDSSIHYLGYVVLDICIPSVDLPSVSVPVLIVPVTRYSASVPLILGTNVLQHFKASASSHEIPSVWEEAFSTISHSHSIPVKANCYKAVVIRPYETRTITGRVRKTHNITLGVTETDDDSHYLNICPRLVEVNPNRSFSKIPVRVCNLSARPITIRPKSLLCNLHEVDVLRQADPFEREDPKLCNSDKTLEDLGVTLPSDTLSESECSEVKDFLEKWKHIFSSGFTDLGCTELVEHTIELSDPNPFKEAYRRIPPGMFEEVREHLQEMLKAGAIRESRSPFSSNVVLVRKKDKSLRFCIDFRKLNNRTVKDAYALPRIEETIDCLAGSKYFTKLDLRSGYWQVPIKESDKAKTAFSVGPLGFFECNRMAFGLTNAPATFQRLMERCMGELHLKDCLIYLDDIIIFSDSLEEHFKRLEGVFRRLEAGRLKLKGSKCEFFRTEVKYLGHIVSQRGIETDSDKLKALKEWPIPSSVKELRSFLGFAGYYRRFVPGFSQISKPLNDLLVGHPTNKGKSSKTAAPWHWGESQQGAFDILISKLSSPPVLAYADYSKPFILHVDASATGLGAVLYQELDGKKRVISYASRGLRANERNYPVHKLEFLALKWAVDKFHDYLYGNDFHVITDNNPLTYVLTSAKLDATSHRWLAALATHNFSIQYRSGKQNVDADTLSRLDAVKNAHAEKSEETVVFPDVIKALINHHLVEVEESPAIECLCLTQDAVVVDDSADLGTSLSDIDWQKEQASDSVISRVLEIVKAGHKPTSRQAAKESESVRQYLREWGNLFLKDSVLYRSGSSCGHPTVQLILPEPFRELAFTGLHEEAGHQGRDRTLALFRSRFFWPQMDIFVERKVRECARCICRKTKSRPAATLVSVETTYPMQLVCMDFLSLEMSSGGFENILVITDHFTRFAQAIPTKNQTAHTTAKVLFEQFICHYGFPSRLHSDQGRNFVSAVISELCDIARIDQSRTTPYHPEGNGMPERFNQTLLNMLGTLEDIQKQNWKAHVPALVHAYNSTRHESTGLSPHFLMFGRHPRLAVDAFLGLEPDVTKHKDHSNYVSGLKTRLDYAYKVASKEARRQAKRHKRRYDLKVRNVRLEPGDRVLIRNVGIKGKHKLADRWNRDIYIVIDQPHDHIPVFRVRKEHGRGAVKTLHRNHLLPFMALPSKLLPEKSAADETSPDLSESTLDRSVLDPSLPSVELPPLEPTLKPSEEQSPTESSTSPSEDLSCTRSTDQSVTQPSLLPDGPKAPLASEGKSIEDLTDLNPLPERPVVASPEAETNKLVNPASRQKGTLNPLALPFSPGRPRRAQNKPKWLKSDDWIT